MASLLLFSMAVKPVLHLALALRERMKWLKLFQKYRGREWWLTAFHKYLTFCPVPLVRGWLICLAGPWLSLEVNGLTERPVSFGTGSCAGRQTYQSRLKFLKVSLLVAVSYKEPYGKFSPLLPHWEEKLFNFFKLRAWAKWASRFTKK